MLGWKIGDVTITCVVETTSCELDEILFPEVAREEREAISWLRPHFLDADGRMLLSFQCFVVESCGRRIVVDTCVGNDKDRPMPDWNHRSGPFLQDLACAGAERESIDLVLCTHLHIDHVGWNTMLLGGKWVPTFPNARYLFGRVEWEHWKDQPEDLGPVITDSVRPIVDAGLVDLVETDHRLTDEVWLESTPGHTPGHVSVRIRSRGERAVISGDVMHHPCQIAHPEWSPAFDHDRARATVTRRAFLEGCSDAPVLVIGTHFAAPTAGRIVRDGATFRFVV
ncbi:MAG: MBL fold metallo-hydrolase [Deltaproteobacteria bacterium]|nr:MBL fold metallo-hydrolase [Deltaproteobacteria bacterium]